MTVVVLSYNRPQALRESLKCLLRQTYSNLEILVMDNPSANSETVREVVDRFPRVRLCAGKSNYGYTGG